VSHCYQPSIILFHAAEEHAASLDGHVIGTVSHFASHESRTYDRNDSQSRRRRYRQTYRRQNEPPLIPPRRQPAYLPRLSRRPHSLPPRPSHASTDGQPLSSRILMISLPPRRLINESFHRQLPEVTSLDIYPHAFSALFLLPISAIVTGHPSSRTYGRR
jgi:hypothetical protein